MNKKTSAAFTLIEMLVVIAIIATIAAFALPAITGAMTRGQLTQAVSNARQIHLSAFAMATDGTQTGDAKYGWPHLPGAFLAKQPGFSRLGPVFPLIRLQIARRRSTIFGPV